MPEITLAGTPGNNGYYKSQVIATITPKEGTKKIVYEITGANATVNPIEQETENSITVNLTKEGISTITVYTLDEAGNSSEQAKKENVGIDWTKPAAPTFTSTTQESTVGYYNTDLTATINAGVDGGENPSGAYEIKYSVSGVQTQPEKNYTSTSETYNINTNGITTITAYTIDKAGNESEGALIKNINLDKQRPAVPTITYGTVTVGEINLTARSSDTNSTGIVSYKFEYKEGTSGAWTVPSDGVKTVDNAESCDYKLSGLKSGTSYYFKVTVTDKAGNTNVNDGTSTIATLVQKATSIQLSASTLNVNVGFPSQLTATVLPENTTNKTIKWTITNTAIATVNNGTVTGQKQGDTVLTATVDDGSNVSATCTIKSLYKVETFSSGPNTSSTLRNPTSSSSPTTLVISSGSQASSVGVRIYKTVKPGDHLYATYGYTRDRLNWYFDNYFREKNGNQCGRSSYYQGKYTGTDGYIGGDITQNADYFEFYIVRSPAPSSGYYLTLNLYTVTVNNEKVL